MTETIVVDVSDQAHHIVDEAIATIEKMERVVKNDPYVIAGVALVALSVGATAGYFWAKKRLTAKYETLIEEEVSEAKDYFRTLHKEDFPTASEAAAALIPKDELAAKASQALRSYQTGRITEHLSVREDADGLSVEATIERDEPIRVPAAKVKEFVTSKNIFDNDDEWDYEVETAKRTNAKPYVIHHDEFVENEGNLDIVTLTWYELDTTLADDSDGIVDAVDKLVGLDNLMLFGHGSGDKNVVYIRNDKSGMIVEVVRSPNAYSVEVLGMSEQEFTDMENRQKSDGG